jgi:hypothetical protein
MAVDGTVEDVRDTPANDAAFGRQTGSRGDSAFPQLRNVYLIESGTHAVCDAVVRGYQYDERSAALRLLRGVGEGMLLMWDRGFHSFRMVRDCLARGCDFLGRVPGHAVLEPLESLPDGSFVAELYATQYDRQMRRGGIRLRVVEYTIDDPTREGHGEKHRLITSILDPQVAPAQTLAVEYHQRWEIEIMIDELDTHQRVHNKRPLRSEKPEGVVQEMYGLLLAHYLVRFFMHEAANETGLDPDGLSFTNALRIIRRKVDKFQITAPEEQDELVRRMLAEIGRARLPARDNRSNPRVVKRKMSKFSLKREQHVRVQHPRKPFEDSVVLPN